MLNDHIDINLGSKLKELLKEKSLSIRKFGILTNVDPATISRIINGKRKATPEHLQRFSESLNIPTSELYIAAGHPLKEESKDLYASIHQIENVLRTYDGYDAKFSMEKVEKELSKYEDYIHTSKGEEVILNEFEVKLQKVDSHGPFIEHLKKMFHSFRLNNVTFRDRVLIGSALLYFIAPVDCIPDYIFPIGYLDDAIAVKLVAYSVFKGSY
ncbi:DUF1232 domain-containing protein [Sutcliffiella rhizosphaerae]|uniref:HTH cro/C1-type domain-containing protein n=1 Tax=Sutcliffiella rhizosphaerae TaxID=2880967 RepID=A0ABN8A909_9BACI|nr:DUF1232 domain-containing protein [Sutcliffiella rhizosphaerae]CAG9621646.1 hypothetical protein BACCIP111883_02419 [Sutcliffiella rhizosphaerae]